MNPRLLEQGPDQVTASPAKTRKYGNDLIMLILLIGCTAYVLLQLA